MCVLKKLTIYHCKIHCTRYYVYVRIWNENQLLEKQIFCSTLVVKDLLIKERTKEMKKNLVLFIAVIVSALALIGCGSDQDVEAITELQSTIDDLQNQVQEYSALQSELESANNSIAELQTELDELTAEKDELVSKLEMLYNIEAVDETMYAVSDADLYDDLYGEVFGNEPAGTISADQEIKVTGKSALDWYEIELDGKKQYINGSLLSPTKPVQQSADNKSNSTKPSTQSSGGNGGGSSTQPSGGGDNGGNGGGSGSSGGGVSVTDSGAPPAHEAESGFSWGNHSDRGGLH